MKIMIFVLGGMIMALGAGLSFYPVFQDFDEKDYEIPAFKSEGYPNPNDLLIMNVYMECIGSDNFFSPFTINDVKYCTMAKNLVVGLAIMEIAGFVMMIVAIFINPKKVALEN